MEIIIVFYIYIYLVIFHRNYLKQLENNQGSGLERHASKKLMTNVYFWVNYPFKLDIWDKSDICHV